MLLLIPGFLVRLQNVLKLNWPSLYSGHFQDACKKGTKGEIFLPGSDDSNFNGQFWRNVCDCVPVWAQQEIFVVPGLHIRSPKTHEKSDLGGDLEEIWRFGLRGTWESRKVIDTNKPLLLGKTV